MNSIRSGLIKRLHVNKHVIADNIKRGADEPAITVQTSKGPLRARHVDIVVNGRVVATLKTGVKPLSCGARIWLETTEEVQLR